MTPRIYYMTFVELSHTINIQIPVSKPDSSSSKPEFEKTRFSKWNQNNLVQNQIL